MQWKDFLYFNKRERKGIFVLIIGIFIAFIAGGLYNKYRQNTIKQLIDRETSALEQYIINTEERDSITKLELPKTLQENTHKVKPCDPNTATLDELRNAGLPDFVASNIMNYRNKGGYFKQVSELRKMYTMTDSIYKSTAHNFYINDKRRNKSHQPSKDRADTFIPKHTNTKFTKDTLININNCDTTILKRIPGIGSYTANKIIRYGNRLGGYLSLSQLREIDIDSVLIDKWFTIDPDFEPLLLNINSAGFSELLRHPYLHYEGVKAIFNYKRKHGEFKSVKEIQMIEAIDDIDRERIIPYLRFN